MVYCILLLFFLMSLQAGAQKPIFNSVKSVDCERSYGKNTRIQLHRIEDEILIESSHDSGGCVTVYNENLEMLGSFNLISPLVKRHPPHLKKYIFYGEKISTVYVDFDKGVNNVYGNIIKRNGKMLFSDELLVSYEARPLFLYDLFFLEMSPDKTKFVTMKVNGFKSDSGTSVELNVFTNNLKLIYKKRVFLPFGSWSCAVTDVTLTNSGIVYFTAGYYQRPTSKNDELLNSKCYKIDQSHTDLEEIILPVNSNAILSTKVRLIDDSSNTLVLAGLTRNLREDERGKLSKVADVDGFFICKINLQNSTVIWSKLCSLDKSDLYNIYKRLEPRKDVVKLLISPSTTNSASTPVDLDLKLKDIFSLEDGNYTIVAQIETAAAKFGSSCQMIEFKVGKEAQQLNINMVPKIQMYGPGAEDNAIYFGCIFLANSQKSCFVFNDNEKNISDVRTIDTETKTYLFPFQDFETARSVCVTREYSTSKVDKLVLEKRAEADFIFYPRYFIQWSNTCVFVLAYSKAREYVVLTKLELE